eukprot:1395353-Amorphochlora_amoeboformis.AAC.3
MEVDWGMDLPTHGLARTLLSKTLDASRPIRCRRSIENELTQGGGKKITLENFQGMDSVDNAFLRLNCLSMIRNLPREEYNQCSICWY